MNPVPPVAAAVERNFVDRRRKLEVLKLKCDPLNALLQPVAWRVLCGDRDQVHCEAKHLFS